MKSIVLGTSAVDTLIHVPTIHKLEDDMSLWATSVVQSIGSTGAGKALALDVLGAEVTLLTDIGQDEYASIIHTFFETTSVDLIPLATDRSTAHTNIMHSQGKRITITTSAPTVNPPVYPQFEFLLENTDVVFLNINQYCRDYIPYLANTNVPIVVDIHDYNEVNPYHQDFIDAADILIASGVNIRDHNKFMNEQISAGKQIVIVTKGSDGLIAMDSNYTVYDLPGYNEFEYVDSNGAGDSFCAGFMLEYHNTGDILQALRFGTVCGGLACTSLELFHRSYDQDRVRAIVNKVSW